MPVSTEVRVFLTVIKAREAPLEDKVPLSNQLQIVSMTVDKDGETGQGDINQSFFSRMSQCTRHYYAPLARSARHVNQVCCKSYFAHLFTSRFNVTTL